MEKNECVALIGGRPFKGTLQPAIGKIIVFDKKNTEFGVQYQLNSRISQSLDRIIPLRRMKLEEPKVCFFSFFYCLFFYCLFFLIFFFFFTYFFF
jgi:hypothetical protein